MELTGFIGINIWDWKLFVILFYAAGYSTGGPGILVHCLKQLKSHRITSGRSCTTSGPHAFIYKKHICLLLADVDSISAARSSPVYVPRFGEEDELLSLRTSANRV